MNTQAKILIFGDASLYGMDRNVFRLGEELRGKMSVADLVMANLESPLTESKVSKPYQVMNLSASPESVCLLDGIDVVSLANNHVQDFLQKGIRDTYEVLNSAGIAYFGVGGSYEDAGSPYLSIINGIKLAVLGGSRYANASGDCDGTAPDDSGLLLRNIRKLKDDGCFVIVYNHWGYEYVRIPSPRERSLSHRYIDEGADVVVGSHPHVFQGIESYKGKTIAYSLGNYIFHSSVGNRLAEPENIEKMAKSFALELSICADHSYRFSILGYSSSDESVEFLDPMQQVRLNEEIQECSKVLQSSRKEYLRQYYGQAYNISKQNVKVRNKYQRGQKMPLRETIKLYSNANFQDLKNRIAGLFMGLVND